MNFETVKSELSFSFIRSGGPGGQHANKVSSKVMLLFDVEASQGLSEQEKKRIGEGLSSRMNKRGQFILTSDETRSQFKNKQIVTQRLMYLLENQLKEDKKRISTRIGKAEKARRLDAKKKRGLRKKFRQRPKFDD